MKRLQHLVVVTTNYPSPESPTNGTFVRNTVRAMARQGVQCTVIHPTSSWNPLDAFRAPRIETEVVADAANIQVFHVSFFSMGARASYSRLGVFSPTLWATATFRKKVEKVLKGLSERPDALYGHFLHFSGVVVAQIGDNFGIPSFVGVGEGEFWTADRYGFDRTRREIRTMCGYIAHSSLLKNELGDRLGVPREKIGVFPNGADLNYFSPKDKQEARKKFGLPESEFLVCSVGNFLYKKGVCRVGEAIRDLEGVQGVFVGSGPEPPVADNISFSGRVPHEDLPWILSASDLFVLPTVVEGSCNAIVEAMACGLPVVSSDGAFNNDLLIPEMSIRVDPLDVDVIRSAIVRLQNDPSRRLQMSRAALDHAKGYDVNDRAQRMIRFMEEKMPSCN